MSVKLHYGLIADIGGGDLWEFVELLRTEITDTATQVLTRLADRIVKRGVELDLDITKLGIELLHQVMSEAFTPDPTLTIIRHPTRHAQYLLAPYGWCQHDIYDRLIQTPLIYDYGYWDNSDKPARFSTAEWDERYNTWRLATDNWTRTMASAGLQLDVDINQVEIVVNALRKAKTSE